MLFNAQESVAAMPCGPPGSACMDGGNPGTCMNSLTCLPNSTYCTNPAHMGESCYGGNLDYAGYCHIDGACHMECAGPVNGNPCSTATNPPYLGYCSSGTCLTCHGEPPGSSCILSDGSAGVCDGGDTCVADMPLFEGEQDG
jgi:hypothetical protein